MTDADDDSTDKRDARSSDEREVLDDVTGFTTLKFLPALIVGLVVGVPAFVLAAAVLALPLYAALELLKPTGPFASGLGLAWFGGCLAITFVAVRRTLRALNAWLRRRDLPTLY
jgi:hypothetical protein